MKENNTVAEVNAIPFCDICKYAENKKEVPAKYDAKTIVGSWAFMCEDHFLIYGMGLGLGVGQRLVLGN